MDEFNFLFLRHGETEANIRDLCSGGMCETKLSARGVREVTAAAELISHSKWMPDKICFSTTPRAVHCKDIFLENSAFKGIKTEGYDDLRERYLGEWEGVPYLSVVNKIYNPDCAPEGGESLDQFNSRVRNAITQVWQGDANLPLIISHGFFWQALHDVYYVDAPWIENGDVYYMQLSEERGLISEKLA